MDINEARKFAGYMEDFLEIPAMVCEIIEAKLVAGKYEEICRYIVQRKTELEEGNDD